MMEATIKTEVDGTRITQEVIVKDSLSNTASWITRTIVETGEEQIRSALIQLGWTPPNEH